VIHRKGREGRKERLIFASFTFPRYVQELLDPLQSLNQLLREIIF
jgi:hypothetical protein